MQLLFLEDDCHPFFIIFQQSEHILQHELLVLLLGYSVGEEEGGKVKFLDVAVGDQEEGGVVGHVEIVAELFVFGAVCNSDGLLAVDLQVLVGGGLGVGAVGVVQQQMQFLDRSDHQLHVGFGDLDYSGVD